MKTNLLNAYRFNLKYAEKLVEDLTEDQMTKHMGEGLENHPAFTLGHLVTGAALTAKYLGKPYEVPDNWDALFRRNGPGDPRMPDKDEHLYPSKQELLNALSEQHELVEQLIIGLPENDWQEESNWRYHPHFPTLKDRIYFMCITHEAMHLGQLAAWRRSMGLDSALAKL